MQLITSGKPAMLRAFCISDLRLSLGFSRCPLRATAAFLFEVHMFGLLKSLGSLAADVVQVVAAPVDMVVDVAAAAVKPVAKAAKELVADVKSLKD